MKRIDLKALILSIVSTAVIGGFIVYFAVSIYSTGVSLKERSEVYQYKTIERHFVNIEQLLKEIKEENLK